MRQIKSFNLNVKKLIISAGTQVTNKLCVHTVCMYHTPSFTGIQGVFDKFTHTDLCDH